MICFSHFPQESEKRIRFRIQVRLNRVGSRSEIVFGIATDPRESQNFLLVRQWYTTALATKLKHVNRVNFHLEFVVKSSGGENTFAKRVIICKRKWIQLRFQIAFESWIKWNSQITRFDY